MKNKGFTLVELIAILALLAVVAIVIGTNLNGLQGKQTDKAYDNFKEKISNAACVFFETMNIPRSKNPDGSYAITMNKSSCRYNSCWVLLSELQDAGLVEKDIIDPSTDELAYIKDKVDIQIYVGYKDGEKYCYVDKYIRK